MPETLSVLAQYLCYQGPLQIKQMMYAPSAPSPSQFSKPALSFRSSKVMDLRKVMKIIEMLRANCWRQFALSISILLAAVCSELMHAVLVG